MSIEIIWRLPVQGDGRGIRADLWQRGDYSPHRTEPHPFARTGAQRDGYTFYDHLSQIAGAVDLARFDALWIPYTAAGEDPLIVAGAFAREARRIHFVPSLRAPLLSAVYAAKIANSFQRLTGGRLDWHLHSEEDIQRTWHGRHWSLDEQIERTGEFLDLVKGFWNEAPFNYEGKYYLVQDGGFPPALQGARLPTIYLDGETPAAYALSARHADVHVFPLLPVELLRERIAVLDALAAEHGRTLRYGVQGDVLARHTDELAWEDLRTRWEEGGRATVVPISAASAQAHAEPSFDELVAGPNLWRGFGLVRPGPEAGLVGGYEQIAERVREYVEAGIGSFVLAANPSLEEALRVGEKLLPRVRALESVAAPRARRA